MARYGLATIFERHPVGHGFTIDNLPLHASIIDSFEIDLSPDELSAKLANLLARQKPFTVKALADEMYGPEKDIPVTTLELTVELKKLHDTLVDFLHDEGGALRRPQFNGEGFTPHVSVYGNKRVKAGGRVLIKDITLTSKVSDATDTNRRVLANIYFV